MKPALSPVLPWAQTITLQNPSGLWNLFPILKTFFKDAAKSPSVCTLGDLSIDTVKASVSRDGREIHLSALEYRLLLVFLNPPGQVLSRNRLLDAIWDFAGEYVNDNTLTVTIKRLREKIEPDPSSPTIIRTVRGHGVDVYEKNAEELAVFRRRQVRLIYQFYNLIPVLTAGENILLPLRLDGQKVNPKRYEELLHMLHLTERKDHLPSQLSGGQ